LEPDITFYNQVKKSAWDVSDMDAGWGVAENYSLEWGLNLPNLNFTCTLNEKKFIVKR